MKLFENNQYKNNKKQYKTLKQQYNSNKNNIKQ